MIIAVDCETQGLDATKFLTGCIMKENGKKKHFYKKEELWEYIKELGKKEIKRGKILNVYAHHHQFDFYTYANLEDKNMEYYCFNPFIGNYKIEGKRINFLDSLGIFKMKLSKMGEMLGIEKMETPEEFIKGEKVTKKRMKELQPYIERDVEIIIKAMEKIKKKLAKEGIYLRRLYTISQIAIGYFINFLKKDDKYARYFSWREKGHLIKPKHRNKIHEAYRGGRCECFQLGDFKEVDYIDINNLYGYASMNIKFPDLKTEKIFKKPLIYFNKKGILETIGISRALIKNKTNKIGLLPIRTLTGNYFPKEGSYMIGTWTNMELRKAEEEGYEIIDIEWTITYEEGPNPFKEITPRLYQLRKESKTQFDNWFYKEMQNRSYGKLAQSNRGYEIIIDNIEEARKYLKQNYEIINSQGYNYIYQKEKPRKDKTYYAPIIPTMINAWARIYMYKQYKKVPIKELIYTDTDSIIMKTGNLQRFENMIGEEIGKFKIEHQKETLYLRGRKTYSIGKEMKIAGFKKEDITQEEFIKGEITSKRMQTMKTTKDIKKVGTFIEEKRNLNKQQEENEEIAEIYGNTKVFKDENISNISYFLGKIVSITKEWQNLKQE